MARQWRLLTAAARYHTVRASFTSEEEARAALVQYTDNKTRYRTRFGNIRAWIETTDWGVDAFPDALTSKAQRMANRMASRPLY